MAKKTIDREPMLGDQVKDKVTGFKGIVTGICSHLTGCDQVGVQGKATADGTAKHMWLDVNRVDITKEQAIKPEDVRGATSQDNGGPQITPPV